MRLATCEIIIVCGFSICSILEQLHQLMAKELTM